MPLGEISGGRRGRAGKEKDGDKLFSIPQFPLKGAHSRAKLLGGRDEDSLSLTIAEIPAGPGWPGGPGGP